jgi:hypothetical protein
MSVLDGLKARLDEELAEDKAFLAKMKPALIKARIRGEAPKDQPPGSATPRAPSKPQLSKRPKKGGGGPNPWLVLGAALVVGIGIAKVIDWRGHAHPRN